MFLALIFLILLVLFAFNYKRFLKPKKIEVFPEHWIPILDEYVPFYRGLSSEKQLEFRQRLLKFLNNTYVQGVGTTVDDLDRVLVACSAVIPVFAFPEFHYANLQSVLLYPNAFNEKLDYSPKAKDKNIAGLVGTGRFENQMILSKQSLRAGFMPTTERYNVGIHEFVHLIDKLDGETDGIPNILTDHAYVIPWIKLIHKKIREIEKRKSDIAPYGATNEAEFFAVASEYFFEKPDKMKKEHPKLYKVMVEFFKS